MKSCIFALIFLVSIPNFVNASDVKSDRFKTSPNSQTIYVTNLDQFEYFCTTDTKQDLMDLILGQVYVDVDFKDGSPLSTRLVSKYSEDWQNNYVPGTFVVGPEVKLRSQSRVRCGNCDITMTLDDDEDDIRYRVYEVNGKAKTEIFVNGKVFGRGTCNKVSKGK